MRRDFHPILYEAMKRDDRIWVATADLGYGMFDRIATDFPDRFVNCSAAEQLLLGIGVGLAEDGKIPVLYSITPFLLFRAAEWIRNYLAHENVAVKLCASGRGSDYLHDGYTHFAGDDAQFLAQFPNIAAYWPTSLIDLPAMTEQWLYDDKPSYLNLKR